MERLLSHLGDIAWVYRDALDARELLLVVHPSLQPRPPRPLQHGRDDHVLAAAMRAMQLDGIDGHMATPPTGRSESPPSAEADITSVLGEDVCACVLRQLNDPTDTLRATEVSRTLRDAEDSLPLARAAAFRQRRAAACKLEYRNEARTLSDLGAPLDDVYNWCRPFQQRVRNAELARDQAMAAYRIRPPVG